MRLEEMYHHIKEFAESAVDGEINELAAYAELYELEQHVAQAKESVKEVAMVKLNIFGGKSVESGFTFEISQTGRYNYSSIPEWKQLSDKLKLVEKQAQMAYKQALGGNLMVTDAGEVIAAAEYVPSKPTIRLTK